MASSVPMVGRAQAACASATGTLPVDTKGRPVRSMTVVANSAAEPATKTASPRTETRIMGDVLSGEILVGHTANVGRDRFGHTERHALSPSTGGTSRAPSIRSGQDQIEAD